MIVTAHQANYLPGLSVIEKIKVADAVIWLDEVQFSSGGWSNRNRMPDGSWVTVPVERGTDMAAFNRVRISEHGNWRQKHIKTLAHNYPTLAIGSLCDEIVRPYRLLVGLNLALLRIILSDSDTAWHFQSHLDGGRVIPAVLEEQEDHWPISIRLATMVAELGGGTYLSGPSGRTYGLKEKAFHDRGIAVEYFDFRGPNDCSVSSLPTVASLR